MCLVDVHVQTRCVCACVCRLFSIFLHVCVHWVGGRAKVSGFEKHKDVVFDDEGVECREGVCWGKTQSGEAVTWGKAVN